MSGKDVHLFATGLVLQQSIVIAFSESQWLSANDTHAIVCLAVEHVGIVLNQINLFLRLIETARVVDPPVGLVLDGHGIHDDAMVFHPFQEGIKPREELVVAVLTQLTFLVTLIFSITTLCRAVGFIITRRRPWSTKDNATSILDGLG